MSGRRPPDGELAWAVITIMALVAIVAVTIWAASSPIPGFMGSE